MDRSSRDDVLWTWEIQNFDHIGDYCLASPEMKLSPLNRSFWQMLVYPALEHAGQDYIQCSIRMTPVQTDLEEVTVLFCFELLSEDGETTAKLGPKCGEFPRDNSLPCVVGLREDFCGMTRRRDCGTLTVKCRVGRLRDPSHSITETLSMTTEVVTQRVTEFIEVDFNDEEKDTEKKIVVHRTLTWTVDGIPQETGSPITLVINIDLEDEWYKVTLSSPHGVPPFLLDCVVSLLDTNGIPHTSTPKTTFHFPTGDLSKDVPHFISRMMLKDKDLNLMNEKSRFLLLFDMEFSLGDVIHNQRSRPVTKPHLPGCKSSSLIHDIERICTSRNHPDWTLSIDMSNGDVNQLAIKPVHKAILASRSPFFKVMVEKYDVGVSLPEMSAITMDKLVRFLYSDYVAFVDCEGNDLGYKKVAEIYRVANMYLIPTLRKDCSSYLQSRVAAHNAEYLQMFADLYGDDLLAKAVTEFLESTKA